MHADEHAGEDNLVIGVHAHEHSREDENEDRLASIFGIPCPDVSIANFLIAMFYLYNIGRL